MNIIGQCFFGEVDSALRHRALNYVYMHTRHRYNNTPQRGRLHAAFADMAIDAQATAVWGSDTGVRPPCNLVPQHQRPPQHPPRQRHLAHPALSWPLPRVRPEGNRERIVARFLERVQKVRYRERGRIIALPKW